MTITEALEWAQTKLNNQVDSPQLDSEVILAYILKKDKSYLYTYPTQTLGYFQTRKFKKAIKKRSDKYPIAYLIKNKEFFKINFYVDERVLIPRPATELAVIQTHQIVKKSPDDYLVCDIGTGSGCIAITLAKYFPTTNFLASDISKAVLKVARLNARHYQTKNIIWLQGDLWRPIEKYLQKNRSLTNKKLIAIANLPYLTNKEITPDLKYEPRLALNGGEAGLDLYKKLFKQMVLSNISPDHLFIEINPEQKIPTENMQMDLLKIYSRESIIDLDNKLRYFHFYKK